MEGDGIYHISLGIVSNTATISTGLGAQAQYSVSATYYNLGQITQFFSFSLLNSEERIIIPSRVVKFHLIVYIKHLVQCLTHSECSVGSSAGGIVSYLSPVF